MSDLLTKLGIAVLLPEDELITLIRSAPYRYKVFQIPKRKTGQFRTIAQPAKEVKALQYWVMSKRAA
jgi:RNA-directed DNA polymerase